MTPELAASLEERGSALIMGISRSVKRFCRTKQIEEIGMGWGRKRRVSLGRRGRAFMLLGSYCPAVKEGGTVPESFCPCSLS